MLLPCCRFFLNFNTLKFTCEVSPDLSLILIFSFGAGAGVLLSLFKSCDAKSFESSSSLLSDDFMAESCVDGFCVEFRSDLKAEFIPIIILSPSFEPVLWPLLDVFSNLDSSSCSSTHVSDILGMFTVMATVFFSFFGVVAGST